MLDFQEITRNIALESEKVGYHPETDTNWCHLPMEMRMECLKWMNFKTRCLLRRTSKVGKSLVDSKKYQFERLRIDLNCRYDRFTNNLELDLERTQFIAENRNEDGTWYTEVDLFHQKNFEKTRKNLLNLFKSGGINEFHLSGSPSTVKFETLIVWTLCDFAPFRFKRLTLSSSHKMLFFLKYCENLEMIQYDCEIFIESPVSIAEFLDLPSVANVKEFRLSGMIHTNFRLFLPKLVQKWIDNDAEVGKSLKSIVTLRGHVELIAFKFADRIIEKSEKEVRIRMNNPKKQILMRFIGHSWHEFTSCKVIPIDLPKSEYGNGDEWIERKCEKTRKLLEQARADSISEFRRRLSGR